MAKAEDWELNDFDEDDLGYEEVKPARKGRRVHGKKRRGSSAGADLDDFEDEYDPYAAVPGEDFEAEFDPYSALPGEDFEAEEDPYDAAEEKEPAPVVPSTKVPIHRAVPKPEKVSKAIDIIDPYDDPEAASEDQRRRRSGPEDWELNEGVDADEMVSARSHLSFMKGMVAGLLLAALIGSGVVALMLYGPEKLQAFGYRSNAANTVYVIQEDPSSQPQPEEETPAEKETGTGAEEAAYDPDAVTASQILFGD